MERWSGYQVIYLHWTLSAGMSLPCPNSELLILLSEDSETLWSGHLLAHREGRVSQYPALVNGVNRPINFLVAVWNGTSPSMNNILCTIRNIWSRKAKGATDSLRYLWSKGGLVKTLMVQFSQLCSKKSYCLNMSTLSKISMLIFRGVIGSKD